jgi:glucokinase
MTALSIVADLGGTNTRVALATGDVVRPDSVRKFPNAEYKERGQSIGDILHDYLAAMGLSSVDGVCVAAAGPVRHGVAEMTNLEWTFDGTALAMATGAARVAILNDLQAQGQALGHIAPGNIREVASGMSEAGAAMLVVGIGTGFNAAPVHDTASGRVVPPSECGHTTMSVRTERDLRLARFSEVYGDHAHGFAGVEDVLSGRGLERLYAFTTWEAGHLMHASSTGIMAAIAAGDPVAVETAGYFVRLLGAEIGDLALIHLPYGGVYLIGGIARAMLPYFGDMGFAAAFRDKGRFAGFMNNFSVSVVEDDYAALTGCAVYLAQGGRGQAKGHP